MKPTAGMLIAGVCTRCHRIIRQASKRYTTDGGKVTTNANGETFADCKVAMNAEGVQR